MHEKILWDLLDNALRNEEPVMTPIERKYLSFHAASARDKQNSVPRSKSAIQESLGIKTAAWQ